MKLEIQTGTPTKSGRYACYLPGVGLATVIRYYHASEGGSWFSNLHEKVNGPVAGWIGPLPDWPENSVRRPDARLSAESLTWKPVVPEYDL